jgi:hypothetical protein
MLASQKGLYSMELVSLLVSWKARFIKPVPSNLIQELAYLSDVLLV